MKKRFEGRVAFITGAASGLGRATAHLLSDEGAKLVLFDRDEKGLAETAQRCHESISVVGDATSAKNIERAAETAERKYGLVEFLVASAGIMGANKLAIDQTEEEWDAIFDLNVKGTWLACRAFIPQMRRRGQGAIVTFGSTAGLAGSPYFPAYASSKGAVLLLTRSLALQHAAEKVRVNCVCPGTIDSPLADRSFASFAANGVQHFEPAVVKSKIPLQRFGEPAEIAAAVCYFLSDAAGFTTGATLAVDGGRSA